MVDGSTSERTCAFGPSRLIWSFRVEHAFTLSLPFAMKDLHDVCAALLYSVKIPMGSHEAVLGVVVALSRQSLTLHTE